MRKETRTIIYDDVLNVEAYRLEGIVQPFPNHFHEYYVIGVIEEGRRHLSCKNKEYYLEKGSIVLFNPGENHGCSPIGNTTLDYRGLNIPQATMLSLTESITGKKELPGFSTNVIYTSELTYYILPLHQMIMEGSNDYNKEEYLLLLMTIILNQYSQPFDSCIPDCREEIEATCQFIEQHFAEPISLDQLCHHVCLSKSTLLRSFTKSKGITPYRYLETIRINEARKLLEQGVAPIEAAIQTGFSDQSHFTNYFISFIGLSPGVYRNIFLNQNKIGAKQNE